MAHIQAFIVNDLQGSQNQIVSKEWDVLKLPTVLSPRDRETMSFSFVLFKAFLTCRSKIRETDKVISHIALNDTAQMI